ncbi:MAG: hypothetical protein ACK5PP_00050 [Acidimicrobiales bacterium]
MYWAARPKNGTAILTYPDQVRVVARNRIIDRRWTEVELDIKRTSSTQMSQVVSVADAGVSDLTLPIPPGEANLTDIVADPALQARYPDRMAALAAGGTVWFRAIGVSLRGVTMDEGAIDGVTALAPAGVMSLASSDCRAVTVKDGALVIIPTLGQSLFAAVALAGMTDVGLLQVILEAICAEPINAKGRGRAA